MRHRKKLSRRSRGEPQLNFGIQVLDDTADVGWASWWEKMHNGPCALAGFAAEPAERAGQVRGILIGISARDDLPELVGDLP